jgi:hypothetical protein
MVTEEERRVMFMDATVYSNRLQLSHVETMGASYDCPQDFADLHVKMDKENSPALG